MQNDLERRTLVFSKEVIALCKSLQKDSANRILSDQLIRSATSVGANYREANETETKRDFVHGVRIARKEAKETIYWIELIAEANPERKDDLRKLWQEASELLKILAAIGNAAK